MNVISFSCICTNEVSAEYGQHLPNIHTPKKASIPSNSIRACVLDHVCEKSFVDSCASKDS